MNERIKILGAFYKQLGRKTQLIIKASFILYLSLISAVIISHIGTDLPNQYDLLLLSEDLIKASTSTVFFGFLAALLFNSIEKGMAEK